MHKRVSRLSHSQRRYDYIMKLSPFTAFTLELHGWDHSLNPERWEFTLKMHLKSLFWGVVFAFSKISDSKNPAVAWKVPTMELTTSSNIHNPDWFTFLSTIVVWGQFRTAGSTTRISVSTVIISILETLCLWNSDWLLRIPEYQHLDYQGSNLLSNVFNPFPAKPFTLRVLFSSKSSLKEKLRDLKCSSS